MGKITVNLPEEILAAIDALAKDKGITKTEALRQAISLNSFMQTERLQGARLLIERPGQSIRELVLTP
jgi:metal-responsive CopG/Arc/MetJ family transcriptional regulator